MTANPEMLTLKYHDSKHFTANPEISWFKTFLSHLPPTQPSATCSMSLKLARHTWFTELLFTESFLDCSCCLSLHLVVLSGYVFSSSIQIIEHVSLELRFSGAFKLSTSFYLCTFIKMSRTFFLPFLSSAHNTFT